MQWSEKSVPGIIFSIILFYQLLLLLYIFNIKITIGVAIWYIAGCFVILFYTNTMKERLRAEGEETEIDAINKSGEPNIYIPSNFMPTVRHFWNLQYGHLFRWLLSIWQLLLSTQEYTFLFWTVLLKKPGRRTQWP